MGKICGGTKRGGLAPDAEGIRCIWHRSSDGFFCFRYLNRRKCNPATGEILEGESAKPWHYKNPGLSRDEYLEKHPHERNDLITAQKHEFWVRWKLI